MFVSQIMSPDAVTLDRRESAAAAARLMSRCNLGSIAVMSGGRLEGICTDRDLVLRCMAAGLDPEITPVSAVMTPCPVTVSAEDDVSSAASAMAAKQIRRLPVIRDGHLVGMLSLGDLARSTACDMEAADALCAISSSFRRG